jgi:hypothetical protein
MSLLENHIAGLLTTAAITCTSVLAGSHIDKTRDLSPTEIQRLGAFTEGNKVGITLGNLGLLVGTALHGYRVVRGVREDGHAELEALKKQHLDERLRKTCDRNERLTADLKEAQTELLELRKRELHQSTNIQSSKTMKLSGDNNSASTALMAVKSPINRISVTDDLLETARREAKQEFFDELQINQNN